MIRKYYILEGEMEGGGGDPPVKPVAPKNYKPTTSQKRSEWNGFLDYINKQPNINLDADPKAGTNLINQYKKTNPNFSITSEDLPAIQYEQYQLRKGDTFGSLKPEQLKYLRQGLPEGYLNRPVDTNGMFTGNTAKLYYPQKDQYGTDVEGYVNRLKGSSALPAPTTADVANGDRIPLPNYDDPKSRLIYAQNFTKKHGPLMQGRGDTPLRVNEVPEATDDDTLTAKEMAVKAAGPLKIDPALLYASAMEEGMSGLYGSKGHLVDYSGDEHFPIDGFVSFGLDNFSDFYPQLVKKGYLPADFKNRFASASATNEKQQKVNTANFKTAADAMKAKAAVMRNTQDETEDYAKKSGITLSPKAKEFFSLINYNAGAGTMQKMLKDYQQKGFLKNDDFISKRPSEGWKGPHENISRRILMRDALKKEILFD